MSNSYMLEMQARLAGAKTDKGLFEAIVNSPFNAKAKGIPLGLGVVVLLLVNKQTDTIDRIALSDTEPARGAVEYSVKPFHEIKIPLKHTKNIVAAAINSGSHQIASDWRYLFTPALSAQEARFNQAGAGIATSIVYPLPDARDGGALIFSYFIPEDQITSEHHHFMADYAKLAAKCLRA
jgi:hypothetical protein